MNPIASRLMLVTLLVAAPLAAEEASRAFDPAVARRITPQEVQRRREAGEKPIILDTRGAVGDDVARGAVQVSGDQIETWAKDVPRKALIVTYCT